MSETPNALSAEGCGSPAPAPMRWLAGERSLWRVATAVFFVFAALKGLGAPIDWALTQAEIDYSHGFIKRGLQGAILGLLHLQHYHALCTVFFLQLITLSVLIAVFVARARTETRFGSLAPVAIFASSYTVTFLTFAVGYTDIPLAAIAVFLLLLAGSRQRFWLSLLLVPVALLIHESFLLMFLPGVLLSFGVEFQQGRGPERRRALWQAAALAVLAVGLTLFTSLHANLTPAQVDQFDTEISARVDFDVRDDFFNVLSRPLAGSVKESLGGLRFAVWWLPDVTTALNLLPVLLLLGHFIRRVLRASVPNERERHWLWCGALVVILLPLSMFLLGVDGGRWNSVCALTAFLVLLMFCRQLPAAAVTLSAGERNAAVLVLAFNMATGWGFFGNAPGNMFPFFPALFGQAH